MAKKKRGDGDGTIFQKRGRWCGEVSLGVDAQGKRRRRTFYADTRKEVVAKIDALRREHRQGRVAEPGKLTVADLVERYTKQVDRDAQPTTAALYRHVLGKHVTPHLGGLRLTQTFPVHVLDWIEQLHRQGLGPRGLQQAFDILQRCLAFGVRMKLLGLNPAAQVPRPKAPKPEVHALSAEQARTLLSKAREGEPWVEAVIALGLCGLRRGEIFGLTCGRVDADRVRVQQSLKEVGGKPILGPVKTEGARREVPLPAFAQQALKRYRNSFSRSAIPHPTKLLFTTAAGSPMRFSNVHRRHLKPLLKQAGVPWASLHNLRHTAATLLIGSGVDPKSAQTLLGHAKAETTLDTYADAIPKNVDAAMEKLGAML